MNKMIYILMILTFLSNHFTFAQNPVVEDIGMSDPHMRVFNDTLYLYCGHDSGPDDKTWVMKNWRIFSSTNLVDWSLRNIISPEDNYMDNNSSDCWAGDAATRNGKYYFYFSDRKRGVGVMVSDSPVGPFVDAIGKPLIAPMHDPTILIDDNEQNTPYLIYGDKEGGGFNIAQINDDMISLAESPKPIQINGEEWQDAPGWMDKNYLFKHNDTYYLSWGRDYAVSKNIYGPYECVGAVGNGHNLNEFAHGSFFEWKGQFYHIWCYYIRPGYKYRESIITYCHFDNEGKIVTDTDFLDKHFSNGVGRYNASWSKIEGEWFYEISGNIHKQGNKKEGFILSNIKDGDWIRFANVTFDETYDQLILNLAGGKGFLEVRTDSLTGNLVGKVECGQPGSFREFSCKLEEFTGKKDLFLVFNGPKGSTMQLDWFKFVK